MIPIVLRGFHHNDGDLPLWGTLTTQTRDNAAAQPLTSVQKQLISQLSPTMESKSATISERGLTSAQWTEYSEHTKRVQYSTVPTSSITAETVTVSGVVRSQKDTAGITTTSTRPLAIQKDGSWFTYGWDLTKNICEVYRTNGTLGTGYTYTPYGLVSASGAIEQPIQWSSEFNDTELGLIYYNYRHYNPMDGRWTGRDLIESLNSYIVVLLSPIQKFDYLGAMDPIYGGYSFGSGIARDTTTETIESLGYILGDPYDFTNLYTYISRVLFIDYIERVSDIKGFNPNKNCTSCIKEMYVYAHGEVDSETAIMHVIKNKRNKELRQSDVSNKRKISDFFINLNINFCKNAHLYIRSCNIGKIRSIKEEIEKHYKDKNITVHTYEYAIWPSGFPNIVRYALYPIKIIVKLII